MEDALAVCGAVLAQVTCATTGLTAAPVDVEQAMWSG